MVGEIPRYPNEPTKTGSTASVAETLVGLLAVPAFILAALVLLSSSVLTVGVAGFLLGALVVRVGLVGRLAGTAASVERRLAAPIHGEGHADARSLRPR